MTYSSVDKESACKAGDPGSIPGLGRSPGKGKGYPLQYSGLGNSMDCIVHGVTKSRTWLSDFQKNKKRDTSNKKAQSLQSKWWYQKKAKLIFVILRKRQNEKWVSNSGKKE